MAQRNSEYGERIEQQSAIIDVLKAMSSSPDDTAAGVRPHHPQSAGICAADHGARFSNTTADWFTCARHAPAIDPELVANYAAAFPMEPTHASTSCRAILDKQIVHICDLDAELGLLQIARDIGVKSVLSIPLLRDGAAIGAFTINTRMNQVASPTAKSRWSRPSPNRR